MFNNNRVACVVDAERGIIAICKTPENAFDMLYKYVADNYANADPTTVENVWVEFVPMNEYIF